MEHFVITKRFILDIAAALDPPLNWRRNVDDIIQETQYNKYKNNRINRNIIDRQMKVYNWNNFLITIMMFESMFNIPCNPYKFHKELKSNNLIDKKK